MPTIPYNHLIFNESPVPRLTIICYNGSMNTSAKGRNAEQIAIDFLHRNGYAIIARNVHTSHAGELDVVAKKEKMLYFIEIKSSTRPEIAPEFNFTAQKQKHLLHAIQLYLLRNHLDGEHPWQLDLIAITLSNGQPMITHYPNILFA